MRTRSTLLLLLVAAPLAVVACGDDDEADPPGPSHGGGATSAAGEGPRPEVDDPAPPHARWDMVESMRLDAEAPRHASDGGGRGWVEVAEGETPTARAGVPGRWDVVYEVGPEGVAEGGWIMLQVSSFWGWSLPQTVEPRAAGYTEVTTDAEGVTLEPLDTRSERLPVEVQGRALRPGETVRFAYGAGQVGAYPDRYRDREERIWISVDGDGDGVFGVVEDSPFIDVLPGPAAQVVVHLPTVVRPGEPARLTVAVLDPTGSAGVDWTGTVELEGAPLDFGAPAAVELGPDDAFGRTVEFTPAEGGPYTVRARVDPDGDGPRPAVEAESNPMFVSALFHPVYWGDLHGHSNYTDGTGAVDDYFVYARDVAALDVIALTDHDHWGVLFVDSHPQMWADIQRATRDFHAPERFVTVLGYEWTSWIHGHRHVLQFADEGPLYSSLDERYETPRQLWDALRGTDSLTFAHHSAGGPIANNWTFRPDPELEPVTEITSVHGVSEAIDSPARLYAPKQGYFVRDQLDEGMVLGFIGSGDGHDGHPGLTHLADAARKGGLAGILADELTREGVLEAFRARRVYATNGRRIFLAGKLAGHFMGSEVPAADLAAQQELAVLVAGTAEIARIELVRSGAIDLAVELAGERWVQLPLPVDDLEAGEYVYVRVVQVDGGLAWTSPWFIR